MNAENKNQSATGNSRAFLVDGCDTIPKLFLKKTAERGDKIAMREKDFGIWQSYTWSDYRARAFEIAQGLLSLGLQAGDVVSIQSEDCKEWVFADLGIMLCGGIVNGVYPTYQSNQVAYTLQDSSCRFLFVEDEEQLDKYLDVEDAAVKRRESHRLRLERVCEGCSTTRSCRLTGFTRSARSSVVTTPGLIESIVDEGKADDLALLIYTSGTTGMPKGSMIPQRYLMFQTTITTGVQQTESDEILTYLPLCHVAERIFSICLPISSGCVINFAESPETVARDFQELSPTFVFAVPRVWEKFYSRVSTAMSEATWIGKTSYRLAVSASRSRARKLIDGLTPNLLDVVKYKLADLFVFRNIKQLLGLDRATYLASGAAPISNSLLEWYLTLGLPITEVYGQTEVGVVTTTRPDRLRQGTVGEAIDEVELKLSEQGEILVRHPYQFDGYLNQPDKTRETIVDGWVHTGDVGVIDENGQLKITDRMKDIIITAGGKT